MRRFFMKKTLNPIENACELSRPRPPILRIIFYKKK